MFFQKHKAEVPLLPPNKTCPLCSGLVCHELKLNQPRSFFLCQDCALIFVDPNTYLSASEEKDRYCTHQNDPYDSRYRAFLSEVLDHLRPYLIGKRVGLDFGCGPTKPFETLLGEEGYSMVSYDPFFFPEPLNPKDTFDFILCHEVIEHCFKPSEVLADLYGRLKDGGILAIRTSFYPKSDLLSEWYYLRDPTHVVFFNRKTFETVSQRIKAKLVIPADNFAFFIKA